MLTVTAAIIERDGKYLITLRREKDSMGGYWEFPGGGVDDGETPDECLIREIKEELDVKAKPISLFDTALCSDNRAVVLFYHCEIEGDPKPLDCDDMRWVPANELVEYAMLPADIAIARKLSRRPC